MAHSTKRYFDAIVRPTCEEYFQQSLDERRFLLAAITLHHVIDYFAMECFASGGERKVMDEAKASVMSAAKAECPALGLLHDLADSAKHSLLATPRHGARLVSNAQHVRFSLGAMGPLGMAPLNAPPQLYIALSDGSTKPAYAVISEAFQYWSTKLP